MSLLIAVGAIVLPSRPAQSAPADVEVRVLQLINQGRSGVGKNAEVMHAGLRTAARNHSSYQSSIRGLTHSGLAGRISGAAPDPYEANGAPDDGFGSYCENVAYYYPGSAGATEEQVAQKFYGLWYNSTGHRNCMFDSYGYSLNVAGVGIYRDAQGYWWATFESVRDVTPPGVTATWTRIEQTSAAVTWSGTWTTASNSGASGGTHRKSATTASFARYTFSGTGIRWIGVKHSSAGRADVRIDGVLVATVDQYASGTSLQTVMFERTGLTNAAHTIEVRVKGTRNAASSGYWTWIDAFERRS
jgi:uncharacterized protein YkwD